MPAPHRLVRPALALTLGLACAGTGLAAPAQAADRPRPNVVTIFGEAGDPVTGGKSQVWHSGPDAVTMRLVGDGVEVKASTPGGDSFSFRAIPRKGESLTYGTYEVVSAAPTTENPGMNVTMDGRSCDGPMSSRFEIIDVTAALDRLWLSFEQRCGSSGGISFGEIRINEDEDPAVLLAPARAVYPTESLGGTGRTLPITVVNTGSQPVTFSGIAIAGEPTKTPLSPIGNDPIGVAGFLNFGIASTTCATLAPGESCVVMVTYRPLFPGPVQAHLRLQDTTNPRVHDSLLAGIALGPADQ